VAAVIAKWVGRNVARFEDASLLTGTARFIDDLEPVAGLRHAAILCSPHAYADIISVDDSKAERLPGVIGVLAGSDVAAMAKPIGNVITRKLRYYPYGLPRHRRRNSRYRAATPQQRHITVMKREGIQWIIRKISMACAGKRMLRGRRAM
jgi:CO/xanthine dehydrogenase Mo-binding subunit